MKGKKTLGTSLIVTLIISTLMLSVGTASAASKPYMWINPTPKELLDASLDDEFTVTVEAYNVTDYYGADFHLYWNRTLLNVTAVTDHGTNSIVDNLTLTAAKHVLSVTMENEFNTTHGRLKFSDTFVWAEGAPKFNGSGVIAFVTFKVTYVPPQLSAPPDYNEANCTLLFDPEFTAMFELVDTLPGTMVADVFDGFYSIKTTNLVPGAPTADFIWAPTYPYECDEVTLTDTSDPGPSGAYITSWKWTIANVTGNATLTGPDDEADTTMHCDGPGDVDVTLNVTNNFGLSDEVTYTITQLAKVGGILDLYSSAYRFCGQVTTVVGKGVGEVCDALNPDVNVTLFAEVTWNGAPVPHVLVAFEVYDNSTGTPRNVLSRTAETDKDGAASVEWRVPRPNPPEQIFGKWFAYASAKVQEIKYEDIMRFDVGYILTITDVVVSPDEAYRGTDKIGVTVHLKNIALIQKHYALVITVYDDCEVPIGKIVLDDYAEAGVYCSPAYIHVHILPEVGIPIPDWAYVGIGNVYVSAFTAMPMDCGVPYCSEGSATFMLSWAG